MFPEASCATPLAESAPAPEPAVVALATRGKAARAGEAQTRAATRAKIRQGDPISLYNPETAELQGFSTSLRRGFGLSESAEVREGALAQPARFPDDALVDALARLARERRDAALVDGVREPEAPL